MRSRRHVPACTAIALLACILLGDASPAPRYVEKQRYAMGTMFRVVASAADPERATRAIDAALREIARLDRVLSHYDRDSELSRLMRQGTATPFRASPDLYRTLEQALEVTRWSEGRFDITVGPLVQAWQRARSDGRAPTHDELAAASRCVGSGLFVLEPPDHVSVRSSCLSLDLGGIGKGVAVDAAIEVLRGHGISDAVVNGGGSTIRAIGSAPGRTGWPVQTHAAANPVDLRDMALSVSQASSEIIAPSLRAPIVNPLTVTVVAPQATTADALSTALLLSSLDEGRTMLRLVPDVTVSWTRADGHLVSGWTSSREALLSAGGPW